MGERTSAPLPLDRADLDLLSASTVVPWERLRDAVVVMTGGTGFVGAWMAAALLEADGRLGLGTRLVLLTRSTEMVRSRLPWLASDRRVTLVAGDVNAWTWPRGRVTHVVAGAASADAAVNERAPQGAYRTIAEGTRRTLAEASRLGARALLLSSGAVYRSDAAGGRVAESASVAERGQAAGYHEGKRAAEAAARDAFAAGLPVVIARLFAFVGPYLPLDRHFAVGNFVADALRGGPITVRGDGTPVRSYLYAGDMALWLWALFVAGRAGEAYNVGSERPVTISDVAAVVAASVRPPVRVEILGRSAGVTPPPVGGGGSWYVPSTTKAREELGLKAWTSLEEGVARMVEWYRGRGVA
jgi:dTDP-glucose 4,6-dehydratase